MQVARSPGSVAFGKPFRSTDFIQEFVREDGPLKPRADRFAIGFPFEKVVGSVAIVLDCELDDVSRELLATLWNRDVESLSDVVDMSIIAFVAEIDGELKVVHLDFYELSMH